MPQTTNEALNELIPLVRTRLADPLPPKRQYNHGQPNQRPQPAVQTNIFSNKEIKSFLNLAAMEVSTLVQTDICVPMVDRFDGFIVDYAVIVALSTKALIEKGYINKSDYQARTIEISKNQE